MASGARRTKSINKTCNMSENDPKLIEFRDNFNKKLTEFYESQCGNLKKPWWRQRVLEIINEIKTGRVSMDAGVRRTPGQYYWTSKYDIMEENGEEILIFKKSSPDDPTVQITASEDYFDVLLKIHRECGHGGRDKMKNCIKDKYYIQRKAIEIFVALCPFCENKRNLPKKSVVSKPTAKDFNVRGHFGLIDFQSTPDEEYKWVLYYQDSITKFLHLRPLRSNQPSVIALELLYIFLEFGAPHVFQSDSSDTVNILAEVVKHWPECNIANHPLIQVEKISQDIKSSIENWMRDKKATNWSLGCRFVQYERNLSYNKTLGKTPFYALFGFNPKSYLTDRGRVSHTLQTSDICIEIEPLNPEIENPQNDSVLVQDSDDSDIDTDQNIQDHLLDEIQTIEKSFTSHTVEQNKICPVCGLEPSGGHYCKSCSKPVHATCGSFDESTKILCFICKNEGKIKKEREEESAKRVADKIIEETVRKRPRLDLEENAEVDTTDIWSSFEKEIGGTARCTLCQQSLPPDDTTLKTHLLEKHQKLHQKREIADDDEDDSQGCYTEVVYLANEANIKREPKQRTYNNHSEPEKPHYTEEDEELDNFGKYITSLLKNLPKDMCMQLQMEIVNLIMTAKLKSVFKPNIGNSSKDHDPL